MLLALFEDLGAVDQPVVPLHTSLNLPLLAGNIFGISVILLFEISVNQRRSATIEGSRLGVHKLAEYEPSNHHFEGQEGQVDEVERVFKWELILPDHRHNHKSCAKEYCLDDEGN